MDTRSIGVFDSGLGGISVLRDIVELMPCENYIYFGDSAHAPYGTKTREAILERSEQCTNFLLAKDVKAIVIACNTASALALDTIEKEIDLPIIGVVKPGAQMAVETTQNKRVGVIATESTIQSGLYQQLITEADPAITVYGKPCPLFVPLVEEGWTKDPITEEVARRYLAEILDKDIDTLIMGCTHYPLLTEIIADIMGPGVTLIDSGAAAARVLRQTLSDRGALAQRDHGTLTLYASDRPEDFGALAGQFLRRPLESAVQHVDIERY